MTFEEVVKAIAAKPFYSDDAVVIYQADCRDILPLIPEKGIGLVLTDPPYGLTANDWDTPLSSQELWRLIKPIAKSFVLTASQPYSSFLIADQFELFRHEWRVPSSVQFFNTQVGLHPTQKPERLFGYLILTYSETEQIIIDPFMGSGTTLVAAKNLGRKCIGVGLCLISGTCLKSQGVASKVWDGVSQILRMEDI